MLRIALVHLFDGKSDILDGAGVKTGSGVIRNLQKFQGALKIIAEFGLAIVSADEVSFFERILEVVKSAHHAGKARMRVVRKRNKKPMRTKTIR